MVEGAAATFESMYLAKYHAVTWYFEDEQLRHIPDGDPNPADYEHYATSEINYGYSVYMALILAQRTSFQKVLVDFWAASPDSSNWRELFETTFGFTTEDFYESVRAKPDTMSLLPEADALDTVHFGGGLTQCTDDGGGCSTMTHCQPTEETN